MIEIKNLTFIYNQSQNQILKNISLEIDNGEFILITGPSGSGKTTLVRVFNGLIPYFYGGKISGKVNIQGVNLFKTETRELAKKVGFVFQNPDNQLFMNEVESEIAFGLENLNLPIDTIKKRVEETLDAIGIAHLRRRNINELSGGEKQKVAIASVLAMNPEVIILDEPTAELDPKSAEETLMLIQKLNDELGLTIILIEHRLDRVIQYIDRIIIMENGTIIRDGHPKEIFKEDLSKVGITIPPIIKLSNKLGINSIPLTIKESRNILGDILNKIPYSIDLKNNKSRIDNYFDQFRKKRALLEFYNISFNYEKNKRILDNINLKMFKGEFIAIMGRNGSGKTTLLKLINGLLRPGKGKILIENKDIKRNSVAQLTKKIGYIFQNPANQFYHDTVDEEISYILKNLKYDYDKRKELVENILEQFGLSKYKKTYPRYLSVGEQQKLALASVLVAKPEILLLDEPTHGMDYKQKTLFFSYLNEYCRKGNLVILVTHDVESVAEYSDRVILLSEGKIIVDDLKKNVLSDALLFSPQINRLVQGFKNLPQDILNYHELMEVFEFEKE
ncbi:MAG: energy-coupling factor ABC transporter ATP-binding protein [Candidatus Lokiarchaeota archaeon]|nr:energy-coupling factor ABC transporter ATP-binding protein [Candidatus Lokiarchaeota archaeon]